MSGLKLGLFVRNLRNVDGYIELTNNRLVHNFALPLEYKWQSRRLLWVEEKNYFWNVFDKSAKWSIIIKFFHGLSDSAVVGFAYANPHPPDWFEVLGLLCG